MLYSRRMPTIITTRTASLWTDQRGCGEDVVLLAGLCDDGFTWGPLIDRLAGAFRVTVVDLRGQSRTPGPPRIRTFVDDVRAALDHLAIDRAHLIGTCFGAVIAQELAAASPERVHSLVL